MCKLHENSQPPLERQSDEALCALAATGVRQAEEVLVTRYNRLVRTCARPFFLIGGDSEDLTQEGMVGLIKAVREYDREHTAALLAGVRKQLSEFEAKILGYYLDGLSCREIAETVGRPPKSVDNAVQRIRRKVARQLLSGDFSDS